MMEHLRVCELSELYQLLANKDQHEGFEAAIAALDMPFDLELNLDYEKFKLRQTQQRDNEPINMFDFEGLQAPAQTQT